MLIELKVSNFAIIENLHIEFGTGLNILSGETGAGKSVLLKSLGLLMGQKGSSESIRKDCTSASIEGSFDLTSRPDIVDRLQALDIDVEDQLLVVKRVLQDDKSRVYLNGSLSTLNTLRDIVAPLIEVAGSATPLIEMTGQHDNRHLLSKSYHLDLLDQYAGLWSQRTKYEGLYSEWTQNEKKISDLQSQSGKDQQRLDFLIFQRDEISSMDLTPGEEFEIESQLQREKNASTISNFIEMAEDSLINDEGSSIQRLAGVLRKSMELSKVDSQFAHFSEQLSQARITIEESLYQLRKTMNSVDVDPASREQLEKRLSDIRKLQKKHGPEISDILQALVKIETEISEIENSDQKIQELEKRQVVLIKELTALAKDMHKRRAGAAKTLEDSVNQELLDLNMKGVRFGVACRELGASITATNASSNDASATNANKAALNSSGCSEVEFMSQSSAKDDAKPLAKFASGGELSRILLSLKRVVGSGRHPRTYLFDEVDTGVSGPTAEKVGKKLKAIAEGQQVICVTHLPQVAAAGDLHFFIQKSPKKDRVSMEIKSLKKEDRVEEIARLISGEKITKTSVAHAQELLKQGRR